METIKKDLQYYKFCLYGFFKNLKFFEPFLILFFLSRNLTYLQIGILYSICEISINIFEIPTGILADAIGKKITLIFSFSSYIISFLIFFYFKEFYFLIIAMLIYGLGDALRSGTHKSLIFEYLKQNNMQNLKIEYYGHTRSWSQIGSAINAILAAFIILYKQDYKYIFLFSTIPYIIDLLLVLSYPNNLNNFNNQKKNFLNLKKQISEIIKLFIYSFKNKKLIIAYLNVSAYSSLKKTIKDYLQPILKTYILSLSLIPFFLKTSNENKVTIFIAITYFFIFLLTSYFSKISGKVSKKLKKDYSLLNITFISGGICLLISGILYNYSFYLISLILFIIIIYFIENLRKPVGIAYISDLSKEKILSSNLSLNSLIQSIFGIIISILTGFLADKFNIGIALSSIGILFIILFVFIKIPIKNSKVVVKLKGM